MIELEETFDPDGSDEDQWRTALDAIDTAYREIGEVVERLHALWKASWGPMEVR